MSWTKTKAANASNPFSGEHACGCCGEVFGEGERAIETRVMDGSSRKLRAELVHVRCLSDDAQRVVDSATNRRSSDDQAAPV